MNTPFIFTRSGTSFLLSLDPTRLGKSFITTLAFFSLVNSNAIADDYVQTDRYTLVRLNAVDAQREPLQAVVTLTFGKSVTTLGKAVEELLRGSGYHWQQEISEATVTDHMLYDLSLPSVLRTIGPLRLEDALQTIVGTAWTLKTNELQRIVWFEPVQSDELVQAQAESRKTSQEE